MTIAGWILLFAACGGITTWVIICYTRVLRAPRPGAPGHLESDVDAARNEYAASRAASRKERGR